MKKALLAVAVFIVLQGLVIYGTYSYFQFRQAAQPSPAFAVVIRESYGMTTGVGLIDDAEAMAVILENVNNIVYFSNDDRNTPTGGGLHLIIFEDKTIRRFFMSNGTVVKNYQDPNHHSWYQLPNELITLAQGYIQQEYAFVF